MKRLPEASSSRSRLNFMVNEWLEKLSLLLSRTSYQATPPSLSTFELPYLFSSKPPKAPLAAAIAAEHRERQAALRASSQSIQPTQGSWALLLPKTRCRRLGLFLLACSLFRIWLWWRSRSKFTDIRGLSSRRSTLRSRRSWRPSRRIAFLRRS